MRPRNGVNKLRQVNPLTSSGAFFTHLAVGYQQVTPPYPHKILLFIHKFGRNVGKEPPMPHVAPCLLVLIGMNHGQGEGTVLESLSLKARGEALSDSQPTVLSCGGVHCSHRVIPSKPLRWQDIMDMPGRELSQRLFGIEPVVYEWNPYLEEAIYAN